MTDLSGYRFSTLREGELTLSRGVGKGLSPAVTCVLTTKNRGAGVPDGGLFIAREPSSRLATLH